MSETPLTQRQAAVQILRERGPMNARDLARAIHDQGLARSGSKHPENTLSALITVDIKDQGPDSEFIRVARGVYGLRTLHAGAPRPARPRSPPTPPPPPARRS